MHTSFGKIHSIIFKSKFSCLLRIAEKLEYAIQNKSVRCWFPAFLCSTNALPHHTHLPYKISAIIWMVRIKSTSPTHLTQNNFYLILHFKNFVSDQMPWWYELQNEVTQCLMAQVIDFYKRIYKILCPAIISGWIMVKTIL